jgi:hypothetical protein
MRGLCLAGLMLLSSCAPHGPHPLTPKDLATAPYQSFATTAFTGSLMYEGGCLLFRDENDSVQLLPVWPAGSSFNGTALTFHRPGKADQVLTIGEEFVMSGRPLAWITLSGATYEPYHRQCPAQPFSVSMIRPAN